MPATARVSFTAVPTMGKAGVGVVVVEVEGTGETLGWRRGLRLSSSICGACSRLQDSRDSMRRRGMESAAAAVEE